MKRMVFGESVQGASHKRVDKECQDSFKKLEYDDGTVIMAIADGHGSKACPYSKSGSSIAVNVFCKVMDEFHASYAENLEMLLTYLNREGDTKVAQAVDAEWKRRVLKVHTNQKREVLLTEDGEKNKAEIYKQYGSTLVGLMITPIFVFAFLLRFFFLFAGAIIFVSGAVIIAPVPFLTAYGNYGNHRGQRDNYRNNRPNIALGKGKGKNDADCGDDKEQCA